jgi:START domain
MDQRIFPLVMACLLCCSVKMQAQIPANVSWHLIKQDNGIQVYTAPSTSGFKQIRISATLEGTLSQVISLFHDIPLESKWVYGTKQAYLIRKPDSNHLLYYNETSLPWPIDNRDVAIWMNFQEDPDHHNLTITQEAADAAVPLHKGIVRVAQFKGFWIFQPTGKDQLHVDYYIYVDPGGSLPAWVVNLFIAKGPYETFSKLRELVKVQP